MTIPTAQPDSMVLIKNFEECKIIQFEIDNLLKRAWTKHCNIRIRILSKIFKGNRGFLFERCIIKTNLRHIIWVYWNCKFFNKASIELMFTTKAFEMMLSDAFWAAFFSKGTACYKEKKSKKTEKKLKFSTKNYQAVYNIFWTSAPLFFDWRQRIPWYWLVRVPPLRKGTLCQTS